MEKEQQKEQEVKSTTQNVTQNPQTNDETTRKIVATILNFILPGVGTMAYGKVGIGFAQLALAFLGIILSFILIGIPIYIAALVWSLVTPWLDKK